MGQRSIWAIHAIYRPPSTRLNCGQSGKTSENQQGNSIMNSAANVKNVRTGAMRHAATKRKQKAPGLIPTGRLA
jgi:hypothetical protein